MILHISLPESCTETTVRFLFLKLEVILAQISPFKYIHEVLTVKVHSLTTFMTLPFPSLHRWFKSTKNKVNKLLKIRGNWKVAGSASDLTT
jgi:hypothetical protein